MPRHGVLKAISQSRHVKGTGRTETSQYPEEKKSVEIPSVVASERGTAETGQA